jgi:transcriptional regulator with XRE-family HTH domain
MDRLAALANNVTTMLSASEPVTMPVLAFGQWLGSKIFPALGVNEFAELAGVSPSAVSSWLNHGAIPYRRTCYAIARALDLDPDEVLIAAGYQPAGKRPELEPEPPAVQYFDAETMTDDEAAAIGRMIVQELARMRARRAKPQ